MWNARTTDLPANRQRPDFSGLFFRVAEGAGFSAISREHWLGRPRKGKKRAVKTSQCSKQVARLHHLRRASHRGLPSAMS